MAIPVKVQSLQAMEKDTILFVEGSIIGPWNCSHILFNEKTDASVPNTSTTLVNVKSENFEMIWTMIGMKQHWWVSSIFHKYIHNADAVEWPQQRVMLMNYQL